MKPSAPIHGTLPPLPRAPRCLVLKWCKTLGTVRHTCTTEEALQSESNLHLSHQRRRAHATTTN